MPGEEKVEPGFEDGLGRGPGMGVGEGIARGVELGKKSPRHGHVEPAKVLGEWDDLRRGRGRRDPGWGTGGMVFNHMKRDIRVAPR